MKKLLLVAFGKYVLGFECAQQDVCDLLQIHFSGYLTDSDSDSDSDILIRLTRVPSAQITSANHAPQSLFAYVNGQFNFGPNLIVGQWDRPKKSLHLSASETLLVPEELWLFDRFLCTIFYRFVMQENNPGDNIFIVHCAGIIKNGRGYIFFGPPGSGKSTIARHSRRFTVLHDDMNIVTLNRKGACIEGVPFNPKLIDRTRGSGRLSMIFSLHQSDKVSIVRGSKEEFMEKVVPEIFLPLPLFSVDRKRAFEYLLNCVTALSNIVPYYRLYFKEDETFWDLISSMEDVHG